MALVLFGVGLGATGCRFLSPPSGPTAWQWSRSRDLAQEAAAFWAAGDTQRAEDKYRGSLRACPENHEARLRLCEIQVQKGDVVAAMECLKEASAPSPSILERLLQLQETHGLVDESLETARALIEIAPGSRHALSRLARDAQTRGNLAEALACYHRLLAGSPGDLDARMAVVDLYIQRNEPHRALAAVGDLAREFPPGEEPQCVAAARGRAYAAAGDFVEAERLLSAALRRGPPTAPLLGHLARVETQLGRLDRAQDYLARAESISPHDPFIAVLRRDLAGATSVRR